MKHLLLSLSLFLLLGFANLFSREVTPSAPKTPVPEATICAEASGESVVTVAPRSAEPAPEAPAKEEKEEGLEHKMMFLALQLGIILFAAKLGGTVAEKCFQLPSVIGELASGILIGPYALGHIHMGNGIFANGIFPLIPNSTIPVSIELYGFCTLASIVLLFLSGVETNFKMFLRYASSGAIVGVGGVVVSFVLGDLCAVYLLPKFIPEDIYMNLTPLSPAALFMGIMSVATSVGITARILSERKVMDSPEGTTTMAAAVIDDVLGIIVLAIGLGVIASEPGSGGEPAASGVNWSAIGIIAAKAFGVWLIGTAIGLLCARRISKVLKMFKDPVTIATLAFGLSIILSGIFQSMGLSLIIGAYVMGLALSRTDIRHLIEENLQSVYTFLVPIFFCVMGMMVDLTAITSKEVLLFGTIYTALAILAKVLGCALPSLACGFNLRGSIRIGAGMIPRGEVALIIAGLGLSGGYLDNKVFSIGILMTLVTTIVAPLVLVKLFESKKPGVRKAQAADSVSRPVIYTFPNEDTAEILLEKLIVAFRNDGFFTANLSPREGIWQVARDADDIIVSRHGNTLQFECTPKEEPLIATAILEVTTDLTALASAIAKPISTNDAAHQLVGSQNKETSASISDSELTPYLKNFLYIPTLHARNKQDAIFEMVQRLQEKGLIHDAKTAKDIIMQREAVMSTGLEHGIAIPHARTDLVSGLIGAVAICPAGISDYITMDGEPVRILVLTLSAKSTNTPHLRLLAHVSQVLSRQSRARILAAHTEEEMLRIFIS